MVYIVKYLLFLSDFNKTWNFSTVFPKNTQISKWMKILLVGTELFHAGRRGGRTDRKNEPNIRSSQFFECAQQQARVEESIH